MRETCATLLFMGSALGAARTGERIVKNFNVTFYNMAGMSLGTVAVEAQTPSKAKILAASLYTCSWVSQTAEAA